MERIPRPDIIINPPIIKPVEPLSEINPTKNNPNKDEDKHRDQREKARDPKRPNGELYEKG